MRIVAPTIAPVSVYAQLFKRVKVISILSHLVRFVKGEKKPTVIPITINILPISEYLKPCLAIFTTIHPEERPEKPPTITGYSITGI